MKWTAALPGGVQHPRGGGLQALVGVGDHQLDAAQAAPGEPRKNSVQKVSASEGPTPSPRTSRRPSVLTATATVAATETIRAEEGQRNAECDA
jgi:hypothetical protein